MRLHLAIALSLAALTAGAQGPAPATLPPAVITSNKAEVTARYEARLKQYRDNPRWLVLPGLLADRQRRRVEVDVESTGLAKDTPCEFLLIAETSGHGYEALLRSWALPSALHQALRFIGQEPGAPFDPEALRFWAKGEPFRLQLLRPQQPPTRVEQLIQDQRTHKPLPEVGFVFAGARRVPLYEHPQQTVYAPDQYDPKALVALFNTPDTVLAVPYLAPKGEVYANCVVHPSQTVPTNTLLTLVIEPVHADGKPRVKTLTLQVQPDPQTTPPPTADMDRLNSLNVQLLDAGAALNKEPRLRAALEAITAQDRKQNDYFLDIRFGDQVELGSARALAKLLAATDSEQGLRIEPPAAGQLYYKALLPRPELRQRADRIDHPAELSLTETNGVVAGQLLLIDTVWKDNQERPETAYHLRPVAGPQEFRRILDEDAERLKQAQRWPRLKVLLVFAPATLRYGQLRQFIEPVLPVYKTVHVFVDEPMPPIPAQAP